MLSLSNGSFSVCVFFFSLLEALLLQPVSISAQAFSAVSDFKLPFAISHALPQIHYLSIDVQIPHASKFSLLLLCDP